MIMMVVGAPVIRGIAMGRGLVARFVPATILPKRLVLCFDVFFVFAVVVVAVAEHWYY